MSKHSLAHEYLEWSKQKLDEIDATLAKLDASVATLKDDARREADRAIARIRTSRDAFKAKIATARSDALATRASVDTAIDAEWVKVELAFQDFLTAVAGQTDVARRALAERAQAQRQSWESSLQAIRETTTGAIEQGRSEADAALHRLVAETEKAEAKVGKISAAGDESWKAIKSGLSDMISIYDRTWKNISKALAQI